MQFSRFASVLARLETTASRLEMTEILAELFPQLSPEEVPSVCYLLQGQLLPPYHSLEFQLSIKMVLRALARIQARHGSAVQTATLFGESDLSAVETEMTKQYKALGDIGLMAEKIVGESGGQTSNVSIAQVYDLLLSIARENGEGSQDRKLSQLVKLFDMLDPTSAKFVARIIVGKLRLGFSTMTMLDALSWASTGTKAESAVLEEALQRKADLGKLAQTYLAARTSEERQRVLANYQTEEGVPIVPQLCQRLNSAEEVIEKMGEVIAEPKYDGLRVQIHVNARVNADEPEIRAFTRNLEEVSHMFPELQQLPQYLNAKSVILDAEAIGYDPETDALLPFQATITRKRKHRVEETAANTPLKFFIFDVIALDGKSLINEKLQDRKDALIKLLSKNRTFQTTDFIRTSDPSTIQQFHESQLGAGLEGLVIKQVDAPYQSGRKNWYWVKIKEKAGTRGKLSDTLDCVVMGYYAGRGKRTQFGLGAILVGVRSDDDTFLTIAKIGTGMSEVQLGELKERCDALSLGEIPANYKVSKLLIPDVWTRPELVVEIAADEITKSPQHSSGVALRFPRLVKFRDDKNAETATSQTELEEMSL